MFTISFDESSGFERFSRDPRVPIMVAGVVYNDNGENDGLDGREIERERLIAYFKAVCHKVDAVFPNDLHLLNSSKKTPALQKELFETMGEFFCKGTYENKMLVNEGNEKIPPRKGRYQICALIKTDESGNMAGDPLFKDDEASGSYLNMATTLIKDSIFLNPEIEGGFLNSEIEEKIPQVRFEFPTRVMPDSTAGKSIGEYKGKYQQNNAFLNVMTGSDRYYAAKVGELIKTIRPIEVVGSIFPTSIKYESGVDYHKYAFLYLADILVGYLKYKIFDSVCSNSRQKSDALIDILNNTKVVPNEDAEVLISARKNILERAQGFGKVDLTLVPSDKKCGDPQSKKILKRMRSVLAKMETKEQREYEKSVKKELDEIYAILEKALASGRLNQKEHDLADGLLSKIIEWEDRYKIPNVGEFQLNFAKDKRKWVQEIGERAVKINRLDQAEYFLEIAARADDLNSNGVNIVRCYDTIDTHVEGAANALRAEDIYGVYSHIYDALYLNHSETECGRMVRDYYKREVFDRLESAADEKVDRSMLEELIDRLIDDRFSNNLRLGKFIYMFERADRARGILEEKGGSLTNKYLFRLYDIGLSAYMHAGQTSSAVACYDKCMKIDGISRDEKNLAKVRCITMYNDLLDYKKAEELGLEILGIKKKEPKKETILRRFRQLLKEIFMGGAESSLSGAESDGQPGFQADIGDPVIYKAASSMGQTYSFLLNPLAEEFFKKVLDYRREQDDADFYITASYCLHWYIENREKEKYEALAEEYFGGCKVLSDQLEYLIREGVEGEKISFSYALYVFIKAFYVFYKDNEGESEVLKKLTHIDETINSVLGRSSDPCPGVRHPWEMIYKYAALLEEKDGTVKVGTNIKKSRNATAGAAKGEIVDLVTRYGIMEYKEARIAGGHKNKSSESSLVKQVDEIWALVKNNTSLCGTWTEEDGDYSFKRDTLRSMFTYMYH